MSADTQERGRLVVGTRALAELVYQDESRWRSMYGNSLRRELGLFMIGHRLAGYAGVIEARLAAKVNAASEETAERNTENAI
jgi:hypothetical protein